MATYYLKNHWEYFYDFRVALSRLKVSSMSIAQLDELNHKIERGRY